MENCTNSTKTNKTNQNNKTNQKQNYLQQKNKNQNQVHLWHTWPLCATYGTPWHTRSYDLSKQINFKKMIYFITIQ